MGPLLRRLALLPLAGVLGLRARLGRQRGDRGSLQNWRDDARDCGLTDLEPSAVFRRGTALTGKSGDLRVRFEWYERADGEAGTQVLVDGPALVPLSLRREGLGMYLENRFAPREIEVGDEAFDAQFYVRGPHMLVRAVLDGETRRQFSALLVEANLEISNGQLQAEIPQSRGQRLPDARVSRVLALVLVAARRLHQPADVVQRLADNARIDAWGGVRLLNLLTLANECPHEPATRVALRRACVDQSDEIRVRAAILLGEDGRDTLREVACAADPPDEAAARAITQLGGQVTPKLAKEILSNALHRRHVETARACLTALGSKGWPEGLDVLASVMAVEQGGELATLAAQALGQTGLANAERPLLEALGGGAPDLRLAAAEALGRVGSAAAVLPLKQAEAQHEHGGAIRRAARQAIAEIHSRTGAAPGQLSLALSTAGTLSLVEDERGRLSLEHPERHS